MFYGWWIVILGFFASAFAGATLYYGFTAFFDPLIKEFGWSYTAVSLAASFRGGEMILMDFFVGFLVDRIGSRRIVLVGSVLFGIGYLILSRVNSLVTFYLAFFTICVGVAGSSTVLYASLINRWFRKRLGLALGIVAAGIGAGGFAIPGIVYLLNLLGFRMVFVIFGSAAIIIGSFIAYFLRNRPEDIGCGPDGVPLDEAENLSEHVSSPASCLTAQQRDYTLKEAISEPTFWIITYIGGVTSFSLMTVVTHVMPYLEHIGYSRYTASIVAMMIPVTSIVGRLGIGWVSDFISRKTIFLLMVTGLLVGIVLFFYAHLSFSLVPFVISFGVGFGGITVLRPGALRDYYGSTYIGSILGTCMGLGAIGNICGPTLAGWIFDTTSSYSLAWVVCGILFLISIPLVLMMRNPPATGKECA